MFYVGIDIGKESHEASIVDEEGLPVSRSIRLINAEKDYQRFLDWLSQEPVQLAMEATGHYWLPLYNFLKDKGYELTVINPLQTETHRRGKIRKTKTDKHDSLIIADLLRTRGISPNYVPDEWIQQLRELTRFRFHLIDTIGDLKRQILSILDKVFPEFESLFSSTFINSARALIKERATPEELADLDLSELAQLLSSNSHGRFGVDKAMDIKAKASSSVGVKYLKDAATVQLRCLVQHLEFLQH